jgi:hypothetical protein
MPNFRMVIGQAVLIWHMNGAKLIVRNHGHMDILMDILMNIRSASYPRKMPICSPYGGDTRIRKGPEFPLALLYLLEVITSSYQRLVTWCYP